MVEGFYLDPSFGATTGLSDPFFQPIIDPFQVPASPPTVDASGIGTDYGLTDTQIIDALQGPASGPDVIDGTGVSITYTPATPPPVLKAAQIQVNPTAPSWNLSSILGLTSALTGTAAVINKAVGGSTLATNALVGVSGATAGLAAGKTGTQIINSQNIGSYLLYAAVGVLLVVLAFKFLGK